MTNKAYLEPAKIEAIEAAASNIRDQLLIRVLFRLGCRISEALGLTVDDIDFQTSTVTIQHLKSRIQITCPNCKARLGQAHSFCPKCGSKVVEVVTEAKQKRRLRTLPIDNETLKMLKGYIKRGGPIEKDGKQHIFGITRNTAWRIVTKLAERANLPMLVNSETGKSRKVSPHRLRDAFAVNALKRDDTGNGMRMLQEHLGHASFNTTAKYRKISGEEQKEWYSKLWAKQGKVDG